MAWAKRQKVGNGPAKALLIYLGQVVGADQSTIYPQSRIAEDLEMSRATVIRALALLEDRGLITRKKDYWQDSGKRKWDTIFLLIPGITEQHGPSSSLQPNGHVAQSNIINHSPKLTKTPIVPTGDKLDVEGAINRLEQPALLDVEATVTGTPSQEFEVFWSSYPRRIGKGVARRAFDVARKKVSLDQIIDGVNSYCLHIQQEGISQTFIAHPSTWLRAERWNDEYKTTRTKVTKLDF